MDSRAKALFEPLSATRNQIRLLKLKSESVVDLIQCELDIFDMFTVPKYRALSYAWGPKDIRQIRVNDQEFSIRINLFDFLQILQARDAHHTGWLWIDQICIDQQNVLERNEQVSVMDQIYRRAHETIVWLGSNPDTELINHLLATIWGEESDVSQAEWEAFGRLCAAPYWSRHWIVQELLLSQNCTLWYGACFMSWDVYSHWVQGWYLYHGQTSNQTQLSKAFFMLDNIRARADDSNFQKWVAVVVHGTLSLCEDARDKVYGVQSYCHPSLRIDVDYALPTEQVYYRAVAKCKDYLIATGLQDGRTLTEENQEFMHGPRIAIRDFCRACFALAAAMVLPATPNLKEQISKHVSALLEVYPSFQDYSAEARHDASIAEYMAAWVQEFIHDGEKTGPYPMRDKMEINHESGNI